MPIILPWQQVEQDTLMRLLAEVVSRDGTDYGGHELSQMDKCQQALANLKQGRAVLCWDDDTETASLMSQEAFDKLSPAS